MSASMSSSAPPTAHARTLRPRVFASSIASTTPGSPVVIPTTSPLAGGAPARVADGAGYLATHSSKGHTAPPSHASAAPHPGPPRPTPPPPPIHSHPPHP